VTRTATATDVEHYLRQVAFRYLWWWRDGCVLVGGVVLGVGGVTFWMVTGWATTTRALLISCVYEFVVTMLLVYGRRISTKRYEALCNDPRAWPAFWVFIEEGPRWFARHEFWVEWAVYGGGDGARDACRVAERANAGWRASRVREGSRRYIHRSLLPAYLILCDVVLPPFVFEAVARGSYTGALDDVLAGVAAFVGAYTLVRDDGYALRTFLAFITTPPSDVDAAAFYAKAARAAMTLAAGVR
jgi:hypothetical protein